jgi:hypothetical protein
MSGGPDDPRPGPTHRLRQGYTIVDAAGLDAAVAKAKGCPILAAGGSVEVCETFEIT